MVSIDPKFETQIPIEAIFTAGQSSFTRVNVQGEI